MWIYNLSFSLIYVPTRIIKFRSILIVKMIAEVCASCSAGAETEPRSVSSGSASWCEGDAAEERGYGSGDSLAEDAALLGDAAQASQPRMMRNQRRDVAVDLHLLRPDVWDLLFSIFILTKKGFPLITYLPPLWL